MTKIVFDMQHMKFMTIFERITHARLKDCFEDELSKQMIFIVLENEISKAIGKHGANIHRLENIFKKKVKIVEFSHDKLMFISNMLYPLKIKDIHEEEDGTVILAAADNRTRGYIIGRAAQNLRSLEGHVRRHFNVKEIKVQ